MIDFKKRWLLILLILSIISTLKADDGYRLWLKYDQIEDQVYLQDLQEKIKSFNISSNSIILDAAKEELLNGLSGLMGETITERNIIQNIGGQLIIGTPKTQLFFRKTRLIDDLNGLGEEGYIIKTIGEGNKSSIAIVSNTDIGVLYGVFHFLRLIQTRTDLNSLFIKEKPRLQLRMLNHWDNMDRTVERGYAGLSIWKWDELPNKIDPRYKDYARANASIGINNVAINNVNASPHFLSKDYLLKTAELAKVFKPYGIRVFLSVNFASPKVLGKLKTADPQDPEVQKWWKNKVDEIYDIIPNFGGFLVKANSEGQPGPQDYNRSHSEGANMMAKALAPHNGVLVWRAFVYANKDKDSSVKYDRAKDAHDEFVPLDGQFADNVFIQIKNGPLDFQPREPFSPLFGATPKTAQMPEFQITQEYLGFSTHLVYLAPMYREVLTADTYVNGKGSTVARVIDGSIYTGKKRMTGIAGVSNIGDATNWTGHPFAQSNWYAFGRLAWNHDLTSPQIADEWIKMSLTHDNFSVKVIEKMMMQSHQSLVDYETPLGLNVLANPSGHYGPRPWVRSYFHEVDSIGLGFDRTITGSNAVSQYFGPLPNIFGNIETCPERFLAWFHHVPWDYKMKSGRTFWNELTYKYYLGVRKVREMQDVWEEIESNIDPEVHLEVAQLLKHQEDDAVWWRDANLWYFQKFSNLPIPQNFELPRYGESYFMMKDNESKRIKKYSTPD